MIVDKSCLKISVGFIKGFCKVVSISVLMCSLHAPAFYLDGRISRTSNASPVAIKTMRLSAQVEVDDLIPFVQDSAYSSASYVRFFFTHDTGSEIGRIDINNLVRCERIAIKDTIPVPYVAELVIAYDFRDPANKQVGEFNWVCATAECPKGSVAHAKRNNRNKTVSIVTAVRIKAVVGADGPDASPIRFGIIGTKCGVSKPYYAFVEPSLAKCGTPLNDPELMRKALAGEWVVVAEATDCDGWEFVDDEAASDTAAGKNEYALSAMDINSIKAGSNLYASIDKVALPSNAVLIAAKYIELASKKYGWVPTVAETRQLIALMRHYGLATSLTADRLVKGLRAVPALLKVE